MRVLVIGGNHRRHLYFMDRISQSHELCGAIIEQREKFMPQPPEGIMEADRHNFIRHFTNREAAEKKYCGDKGVPKCEILEVTKESLNSDAAIGFIKRAKPDAALVFGSDLIAQSLIDALPKDTINMHLGLSPRYRGAATLFWPFYFLEPNYAGSTFHYLVSEPDAGNVVHQVVPQLKKEDGIHDVACRTLLESAEQAIKLLDIIKSGKRWKTFSQKGTGKNFLFRDFRPEHLRVIYNLFDDDIVKRFMEGSLKPGEPKLCRQF
ncbi:methionyl-tRNA formyltransferase [Candidatus Woesearchaeota archaeon]|nr:methionyl-tRNA formyltransferase [Candidatus Woesearchaeota archaeon]